jgi:hypothetical protein
MLDEAISTKNMPVLGIGDGYHARRLLQAGESAAV